MQRVELEVKPRDLGEKDKNRNLNQLRTEGWVPGTLYGHGDPVSIAVNKRAFLTALHNKAGVNALFNIKLGNESALGVIKEIQKHLTRNEPIHVDLLRIDTKEKLDVNVPVHHVGEAPGVKNSGGILEMITREMRVRCLPDDIPTSIDVDVSALEISHAIKVKDVPPIKGVEFMTAADTILVNIVAPKVEEEKPAAVAAVEGVAAGTEPEVITKGKKEEGEAGAAPAAAAGAAAAAPGKAAAPAKAKDEKKK